MNVFGPIPSRRLGKSLGVNNIPHKVCSYSCLYCQIGKARKMQIERQEFYKPEVLVEEVKSALCSITENSQYPDYITIVPDGEPTLDINLGVLIEKLKIFKIPIAVITNASLIYLPDVQKDLQKADYVSIKTDAYKIETWKKINMPHKDLKLTDISCGISSFLRGFNGRFVTETMLVKGINDSYNEIDAIARFIETYNPDTAYLSIPTRPTAFPNVFAPDEKTINETWNIIKARFENIELLIGYEGNSFAASGNSENDLLSITAVHPMREDAVLELLRKNRDDNSLLDIMIKNKQIEKVTYNDIAFYLRKFKR